MEENTDSLKFSESCLSIASTNSDIFISSFPGKIVFGKVDIVGFKKLKYFLFEHYNFVKLYVALVNIVKFFSTPSVDDDKSLILSNEEVIYFWTGKELFQDKKKTKVIKFGIEYSSDIVFEILLNIEELNDLVFCISRVMLSCFCLKPLERDFLHRASKETITNIMDLNEVKRCKSFLIKFKKEENISIDLIVENNLIDLLIYYNETIVIYRKIQSLYNPFQRKDLKNVEAILNS